MDAAGTPLRSGFGRNSFATSGEECSFARVAKFFRCLVCWPLLLPMYVMVLVWPLTCLGFAFAIFSNVKDMVDAKAVSGLDIFWVAYYLFFLQFFLKIGCRREILPGIWLQFVDRIINFARPGQMLKVEATSSSTSDVVVDGKFIRSNGKQSWVSLLSGHLRRSIDMTLLEELTKDVYGAQGDDIDNPQHFLSGQPGDSIGDMSEVWTCHSSVPSFPAMYCFCEKVPLFRFSIPMPEEVNVLGYVLLLQTSTRLGAEDMFTMRNPCAALLPSCVGHDKVVARRGYWAKFLFGNFPAAKPDAFVFRRSMVEQTGLKVVHTFRLVAPLSGNQVSMA